MALSLRTRILLITAIPIVTLVFATLAIVGRTMTGQIRLGIHDDLMRAAAVASKVLEARARTLTVAGDIIARDPKFFSVLTIPGSDRDRQLTETVAGVARDFNLPDQTDLFEVLDRHGRLLATVGRGASDGPGRAWLVERALTGRPTAGVLETRAAHYQAQAIPVRVGGRIVGVLLLGARLDDALAHELERLTRSQVTFLSGPVSAGTTLLHPEDLRALIAASAAAPQTAGGVFELRHGGDVELTLMRDLPGDHPQPPQRYAIQRSLAAETAFLRAIQAVLIGLGALALFAAVGAGAYVARRILSPVRRLVHGAEEMERGNYDYPLELGGGDEIARLARRFDDMRARHRRYVTSLQELDRVKSEFIAIASHELRTPIGVTVGFQELMVRGMLGPVTEDQKEALEAIGRSMETLTRIAEDATRVAQVESQRLDLARGEHDLRPLIDRAVSAALADGPNRQVAVDVECQPGSAWIDGPRLEQAVANLVRNGIRFSPDGSRVTVRAGCARGVLEIVVADSGVGIPRDRQATVFERAFMVRESEHHHSSSALEFNSAGLGLGLPIANGIVRAHGGTIVLESEPGRGSTFTILIPVEAPNAATARSLEAVA
jgi:signal transduction histidine kinase